MRGAAASVVRRWNTHSTLDTEVLGQAFGAVLQVGDLLLLYGGLGSGKTTLARGIARGMGVEDEVKSPTFALHLRHDGICPLHHIDLYRLEDPREILELGLDDILGTDGVCVVEWAERLESAPRWGASIRIEEGPQDQDRTLTLQAPVQLGERLQAGASRAGLSGVSLL